MSKGKKTKTNKQMIHELEQSVDIISKTLHVISLILGILWFVTLASIANGIING